MTSARKIKRRIYGLMFQPRMFPRLTAEDHAWLNMAPVGREFGSPDYERLMQEDAQTGLEWSFPDEQRIAEIRQNRTKKKKR